MRKVYSVPHTATLISLSAHLEQVPITAVVLDLYRHIGTTRNAGDVQSADVDGNTECAFTGCGEEGYGEREVDSGRRDVEDGEVRRVLVDRDQNGGCLRDKGISALRFIRCP